jgi:cytochrome c oxidase subunit 2
VLTEGKEVTLTADDDYIKRSIHHPPKEVVKGFAPQMPKADLSEHDVADLIAYIKSLH